MSRFVKVPVYILKSKISASAKLLWIEFARVSTPKRPNVSANTKLLAEKMGLSVATIRRLIRELVKAGLLVHHGYIDGRVRVYNLTLNPSPATGEGLKSNSLPLSSGERPRVRCHDELTQEILENWSKRFPCLDGLSGRPRLIQCVGDAIKSPHRNPQEDLKTWIEISLKNTSRLYSERYYAEKYH